MLIVLAGFQNHLYLPFTGKGVPDCIIIYLAIDYKIFKVKLTEPKTVLQH